MIGDAYLNEYCPECGFPAGLHERDCEYTTSLGETEAAVAAEEETLP